LLRPSLRARFEVPIFVPGLDDRKEDIPPALLYFIKRSLLKRVDIDSIFLELFDKNITDQKNFLSENEKYNFLFNNNEIKILTNEISSKLLPIAEARLWPENFRALRNLTDIAIIRAKKLQSPDAFVTDIVKYFLHYLDRYSNSKNQNHIFIKPFKIQTNKPEKKLIIPSGTDSPIITDIINILRLKGGVTNNKDAEHIARFIYQKKETFFNWQELQEHIGVESSQKRTVQNRISVLKENGFLKYFNKGLYQLSNPEQETGLPNSSDQWLKRPEFLTLPGDFEFPEGRKNSINEVFESLKKVKGVYISGEKGCGKTTFSVALGEKLKTEWKVYYYHAGSNGIMRFLEILSNAMVTYGIIEKNEFHIDENNTDKVIRSMSDKVEGLFKEDKPLLILDNCNMFDPGSLIAMIESWENIKFVFVGRKLKEENLEKRFIEYELKHFELE